MATKKKRFSIKTVPSDQRMKSQYGSTWSAHELGLARDNDSRLYNYVNKNQKALLSMNKDVAIGLMKKICSYDLSGVKAAHISKSALDYIIRNHR